MYIYNIYSNMHILNCPKMSQVEGEPNYFFVSVTRKSV